MIEKSKDWKRMQQRVRDAFREMDPPANETAGSGAVKGNGDVISSSFVIECKLRNTKNYTIEQEHLDKIKLEAAFLKKTAIIASENNSGEILISMTLADFQGFFY